MKVEVGEITMRPQPDRQKFWAIKTESSEKYVLVIGTLATPQGIVEAQSFDGISGGWENWTTFEIVIQGFKFVRRIDAALTSRQIGTFSRIFAQECADMLALQTP